MGLYVNRRQWLKTSAIAAAGLVAGSNFPSCRRETSFPRSPSGEESLIKLNSNESPYGISENVRQAIIGSINQSNRYPQKQYFKLKELIAEREKVSPEEIILGAGSTEIMTTLIHLYGARGEALVAEPTYFDFVYYAENANCRLLSIPLNDNFEHDLQAMEQRVTQNTSLVYICNPNNPTGSITPGDKMRPFCERVSQKVPVIVDEAYHEYVEDVVVTRTFSKIFGLAGLRVGYGIARPEIIEELDKIERNFAPVAWLSLNAALASYKNVEFTQYAREKNKEVKSYLYQELGRLGLSCIPSHTNFVLFRVNRDSQEMFKEFEDRNVLIRAFNFNGGNWIRVSLGTLEEMQAFVSVLADIA
jgi:histidinol-phosphate aminotransferase